MNKDIFEGKWKQIRGEAKAWWGKLTDDDLDRAPVSSMSWPVCFRKSMVIPVSAPLDEIDKRVTEFEAI